MATFAINDFNVGQNLVSVTLQDDAGNVMDLSQLGHLMEFDASVVGQDLKIVPITDNGRALWKWLPQGYEGRVTLTRYNGALNNMIVQMNEQWFTFGLITQFQVVAAVLNPDGGDVVEFL
jgi:DNA mismatch repair protein MutH